MTTDELIHKRDDLEKYAAVLRAAIEHDNWAKIYRRDPENFPATLAEWQAWLTKVEKKISDLDA